MRIALPPLLALACVAAGPASCQTLPETRAAGSLAGIASIRIEIDPASAPDETARFVDLLRADLAGRSSVALVDAAGADARLVVLGRIVEDSLDRETFIARLDLHRGDAVVWHHATPGLQIGLTKTDRIAAAARGAARRLAEALRGR